MGYATGEAKEFPLKSGAIAQLWLAAIPLVSGDELATEMAVRYATAPAAASEPGQLERPRRAR